MARQISINSQTFDLPVAVSGGIEGLIAFSEDIAQQLSGRDRSNTSWLSMSSVGETKPEREARYARQRRESEDRAIAYAEEIKARRAAEDEAAAPGVALNRALRQS